MRHLIDFGDMTRAEWDALYARCETIMAAWNEKLVRVDGS